MNNLFSTVSILIMVTVMIVQTGCDSVGTSDYEDVACENPPEELVEHSMTYFEGGPYSELTIVQNQDKVHHTLSAIYEGYGGLWSTGSASLTIGISDMNDFRSHEENVLDQMKSALDELEIQYTSIKTVEVRHSFSELVYVRDLLNPVLHSRDDIVESYIDVQENSYFIGILESSDKSEYHHLLSTYCISPNMITLYETGPVETAAL